MTLEETAKSVVPAVQQLIADLDVIDTFETMNVQREDVPTLKTFVGGRCDALSVADFIQTLLSNDIQKLFPNLTILTKTKLSNIFG